MKLDKNEALSYLQRLSAFSPDCFGIELFVNINSSPSNAAYRRVAFSTDSKAWKYVRDMVHRESVKTLEAIQQSLELPEPIKEDELRLLPAEEDGPVLPCFSLVEDEIAPYDANDVGKIAGFLFKMTLNRAGENDALPEPRFFLAYQQSAKNISINKRILASIVLKMNHDEDKELYGRKSDADFEYFDMDSTIVIENRLDAFCVDGHSLLKSDKLLDSDMKRTIINKLADEAIEVIKQLDLLQDDCKIEDYVDKSLINRLAALRNNDFFPRWKNPDARTKYLSNARKSSSDYSRLFDKKGEIRVASKSKMSLFVKMLGDSLLKSQLTNASFDVTRREPYLLDGE